MTRRELLAVPLATMPSGAAEQNPRFVKSICSVIFPEAMPLPECFARAKKAGFDAMEVSIGRDLQLEISREDAHRIRDAARQAGIRIATIWVAEPLHANPLNADDPAVRARGVEAIRKAIAIAQNLNCGALLLYAVRLGNGAKFQYGDFFNVVISFLLIALAVYYFVVLPVNALMKRFEKQPLPDKKKCPECESDIPITARKCAFCTSAVA